MGVFDSVYEKCPSCEADIEYQSKAADAPQMRRYTIHNAPIEIAMDVLERPEKCTCGAWVALRDINGIGFDGPILSASILEPPKKTVRKHPQGYEWWPSGEPLIYRTMQPTVGPGKDGE